MYFLRRCPCGFLPGDEVYIPGAGKSSLVQSKILSDQPFDPVTLDRPADSLADRDTQTRTAQAVWTGIGPKNAGTCPFAVGV